MRFRQLAFCLITTLSLFVMACQKNSTEKTAAPAIQSVTLEQAHDVHSYGNADQVRVKNVDLDLEVLFDRKVLKGTSTLTVERKQSNADKLILDTRDLKIIKAETSNDGNNFTPAKFTLGPADKILGAPLTIELPAQSNQIGKVRIEYESSPTASGVQWLDPAQTAGKQHPYVFTQSESIAERASRSDERRRRTTSARQRRIQFQNGTSHSALPDRVGRWQYCLQIIGCAHWRVHRTRDAGKSRQ
jgi:leukotriene-A4 hydrolase